MTVKTEGEKLDVVILGAGISGLTLAHSLARLGRRVLLAEASGRTGGVVHSEMVDGYLLERGPNSFTSSPIVDELLSEIGLRKRAIRRPLRDYDRYVYKGGRLRRVPTGPLELLRTDCLTTTGKLRLLFGLFGVHAPPRGDLSLGEYFRPRIGNEAVDTLLRPFIAGVYAADADRLSFEAALPRLYKPATEHPLLAAAIRAMIRERRASAPPKKAGAGTRKSLVSFPNGLEEFTTRLTKVVRKKGIQLELNRTFTITGREGEVWTLKDNEGHVIRSRRVVLALPAGQTADALAVIAPKASEALHDIQYARLTVVHAGVSAWDVRARERGFGFLNAQLPDEWKGNPSARVRALGMIWSDQLFPGRAPTGMRLYTCFYGGEKDPGGNDLDDETLQDQLHHDMRTVLRLRPGTGPSFTEITRWERALPIFAVGQAAALEKALDEVPRGIDLLSNFRGGISIPDRIARARELAESL